MKFYLLAFLLTTSVLANANERMVSMDLVDATGKAAWVGEVRITETPYGLVFTPQMRALPPGLHGFHVHENPSCAPKDKDGKPVAALAEGSATQPVLAPRLKLSELPGRSLMLHAGGDNHADHPATLGGGGARIACGVIN
ncbi:superoxide dismutase family protein [Arenimonas sp.]|jgi:Cu-Zn family superoxide dismutase|uniref:superoxide dismutase family protein n=1 Tax=Arenimonas sp. TaxID=1872635 RepID=UPI0037BE65FA